MSILDRHNKHLFLEKQRNDGNSFIANVNILVNNIDYVTDVGQNLDYVKTVSNNIHDVITTASNINNINIVGSNVQNVISVSNDLNNIDIVSDNITDIKSVRNNITAINDVYRQLNDIHTAANYNYNSILAQMQANVSAARTSEINAKISETNAKTSELNSKANKEAAANSESKAYEYMLNTASNKAYIQNIVDNIDTKITETKLYMTEQFSQIALNETTLSEALLKNNVKVNKLDNIVTEYTNNFSIFTDNINNNYIIFTNSIKNDFITFSNNIENRFLDFSDNINTEITDLNYYITEELTEIGDQQIAQDLCITKNSRNIEKLENRLQTKIADDTDRFTGLSAAIVTQARKLVEFKFRLDGFEDDIASVRQDINISNLSHCEDITKLTEILIAHSIDFIKLRNSSSDSIYNPTDSSGLNTDCGIIDDDMEAGSYTGDITDLGNLDEPDSGSGGSIDTDIDDLGVLDG